MVMMHLAQPTTRSGAPTRYLVYEFDDGPKPIVDYRYTECGIDLKLAGKSYKYPLDFLSSDPEVQCERCRETAIQLVEKNSDEHGHFMRHKTERKMLSGSPLFSTAYGTLNISQSFSYTVKRCAICGANEGSMQWCTGVSGDLARERVERAYELVFTGEIFRAFEVETGHIIGSFNNPDEAMLHLASSLASKGTGKRVFFDTPPDIDVTFKQDEVKRTFSVEINDNYLGKSQVFDL